MGNVMHVLGIETRQDIWAVVHLKSNPINVKVERFFSIAGETFEDKLRELKEYINDRALKGVRISLGLPRESSLSMLLSIPAPRADAIEGILTYELGKHIPFNQDEVYHGFQVVKKEKKVFSLLLAAARKNLVDGMVGSFTDAGLTPACVATWQSSLFNALYHWDTLASGKNTAFIGMNDGSITVDIFSDLIPVYSKKITTSELKEESWLSLVEKELKHSLFCLKGPFDERKIDEGIIISEEEPKEDFLEGLSKAMDMPIRAQGLGELGLPSVAAPALGAALCGTGKGRLKINLAPPSVTLKERSPYYNSRTLSAAVIILAILAGSSYLIKDWRTLRGYEAALSEVRLEKARVGKLTETRKSLDAKIHALSEIDGRLAPGPLEIMRELTWLLPSDTWLTGIDYRGGDVTVEGYSNRASSLLLKMGSSRFMSDFEFTGPVVKAPDGTERFRMSMKVNDYSRLPKRAAVKR